MTRQALLLEGGRVLKAAGISQSSREARLLMRWAAGMSGAELSAALDSEPLQDELDRWKSALHRRSAREPASHIIGEREFWKHSFLVTSDVLDPRPETEVLVQEALRLGPFERILDLGTGSGCILLSLLAEWLSSTGVGSDVSHRALKVARQNADRTNVGLRAEFHESDWFAGVSGPFDLVVSNPPYISDEEIELLEPEVREYEPISALTLGSDDLAAYRHIAIGLQKVLMPGGAVLVETGAKQAYSVGEIFSDAGLTLKGIVCDLDQRPRVVIARL